jgi:hypothetical protein
MNVNSWLTPTKEATRIVRSVFASISKPHTTKEIFQLCLQEQPKKPNHEVPPAFVVDRYGRKRRGPWPTPHSGHPVRSVRCCFMCLYLFEGVANGTSLLPPAT